MQKAHCDNCDTLIVDASTRRSLTVQPYGYQCIVSVTVEKGAGRVQELCADCLHDAITTFAVSLVRRRPVLA